MTGTDVQVEAVVGGNATFEWFRMDCDPRSQ